MTRFVLLDSGGWRISVHKRAYIEETTMALKEIRIPVLNKGPWYNEDDEILVVRLAEKKWRIGEGLGQGETKSSSMNNDGDTVSVIVSNIPGPGQDVNYGEWVYIFKYKDWKKVFELEVSE